jgi:hypothetical protein
MKNIIPLLSFCFLSMLTQAQNSPLFIWGPGLDGSTYQKTAIYSDITYGLLFDAPKDASGNKLPIQFNWRGGGVSPLYINAIGNVGIGTGTPERKLHVSGTYDVIQRIEATDDGYASIELKSNGRLWQWSKKPSQNSDQLQLYYNNGITWSSPFLTFSTDGNLAIGTADPKGYKLAVAGKAIVEEVTVKLQDSWPDYVFNSDYKLLTLEEIKTYIDKNKHLPEVPSAKEMEANGVQLGEMNMLLLKKIEELTLHVIDQNKKLDAQSKLLAEQNKRIDKLETDGN